MGRIAALSLLGCLAFATAALADEPVKEGRSVSACSAKTLVCAVMKDGSMRPTDECDARRDGPVRIIPGDCYDED